MYRKCMRPFLSLRKCFLSGKRSTPGEAKKHRGDLRYKKKRGDMAMEGGYKIRERNLTVEMPAEIDHHSAQHITSNIDYLIEANGIRSIVFDFNRTSFMDSSGIGILLGRYKKMNYAGGKVMVIRANPSIRKIETYSGVTKIMNV